MNKQQRGVTLIELMISMVLGLALIAGVSSLFLQMQKSNRVQRALGAMADESSYVQEVLQKEIRRADGLRSKSDLNGTEDKVFIVRNNILASGLNFAPAATPALPPASGEYIKGGVNGANDAFVIRYQLLDVNDLSVGSSSNGSSPCTQNVLLAADEDPAVQEHVVSVYFYLNGNTLSCAAQRSRQDIKNGVAETCIANCTSATDYTPVNAPVDLISNVVELKLSYGVDSDSSGSRDNAANYYVNAASVPAADWNKIVSVRLSVVIRSEADHLTDTIVPYTIDGTSVTPIDHRLYKVFTTTIALRNRLL